MNFLDILSDCHKPRHGTEGLAHEVSVKARNDYADASFCQFLAYVDDAVIEELSLVDTHDLDVGLYLEHAGRGLDGCAGNAVGIVRDDIKV